MVLRAESLSPTLETQLEFPASSFGPAHAANVGISSRLLLAHSCSLINTIKKASGFSPIFTRSFLDIWHSRLDAILPVVTIAVDTARRAASVFSAGDGGSRVAFTGAVPEVSAAVTVSGRGVDALGTSGLAEFGRPVCMACDFLGRCVVDSRLEAVTGIPCMAVCVLMVCAVLDIM